MDVRAPPHHVHGRGSAVEPAGSRTANGCECRRTFEMSARSAVIVVCGGCRMAAAAAAAKASTSIWLCVPWRRNPIQVLVQTATIDSKFRSYRVGMRTILNRITVIWGLVPQNSHSTCPNRPENLGHMSTQISGSMPQLWYYKNLSKNGLHRSNCKLQ